MKIGDFKHFTILETKMDKENWQILSNFQLQF